MELTPIIEESFTQYAGAVLQSRALVDVRDCLKPSARQIFYCLYTDKFTSNKPYKKVLKMIGSVARIYIHGDSSAEGIIMRAGQPFAFRYPLVDGKGNFGTIQKSGNWAAPRYPDARLSEFTNFLFEDLDKETVFEWRDNYDDTEKYPAILPSKGFYNIVNGTFGIGIGMGSSIPQFNLKEVNEALIKLLWNPDIDFNEIYCAPDFATGAILLNDEEVRESMKNGNGKACKLRSIVEFDPSERCLIVKEIPYGVYTNTICEELEGILNGEENPGIDRFNDLSGSTPLLKIYLTKNGSPDRVLKYLYKNTSLQYHYSINMTMLDNGRFPKIFTWKEALQAHLDHETTVYRQGFLFDLRKIKERLHIIEGLIKAISIINEVIALVKSAADTANAKRGLMQIFGFTEVQAKAILDIKLARLAHMEVAKLENEQSNLIKEKDRIEAILKDENLLKKEIENGLRAVANKYGDERRTQIMNLNCENEEPVEVKTLQLSLTNKNAIFVTEASTLFTQRRGGVGSKLKMDKGEYVISTISTATDKMLLLFTNDGDFYPYRASALPIGEKIPIESFLSLKSWQNIKAIAATDKKKDESIIFITKNGYIKKSNFSEYNTNRSVGVKALTLEPKDEICSVIFTENERVGILTNCGNFIIITTNDVRPLGRISKGVKAIKLNDGDFVIQSHVIPKNGKEIVSISAGSLSKRMALNEFASQGKNTKGSKIQKLTDGDTMADFIVVENEKEILVAATTSCIKISLDEIPSLSKLAQGNKTIRLPESAKVIGLSKF